MQKMTSSEIVELVKEIVHYKMLEIEKENGKLPTVEEAIDAVTPETNSIIAKMLLLVQQAEQILTLP